MRRVYKLYCYNRPGYVITCVEAPAAPNDVQFRIDIAREYDVQPGEGFFEIVEDGIVINKVDIPV